MSDTQFDRLIELIKLGEQTEVFDGIQSDMEDAIDMAGGTKLLSACTVENLAYYLLKNGVIVPPCKVGDTVYMFGGYYKGIEEKTVEAIKVYEDRIELMYDPWEGVICDDQQIGHTGKEYSEIRGYYLSRKEAEQHILESE